jgi:ABC-type proline/glycine betaine transport system permease subunit
MFGANDFIMYGTNWGGAVLRHDWLVLLGLGICALRKERWVLAGLSFGLATSIRAFPAFAVIGMCIPALWWIVERWRETKKLPRIGEILRAQRPTFIAGLASVLTVAVLVLLTSIVLGFSAWPEWAKKVDLLDAEPHVNPISLRTVIAGTEDARHRLLRARLPLYIGALVAYIGMIAIVARKKRLEHAAALGLIFLPLLMFPANYYLHIVMLLPLVAVDWRSIAWRERRKERAGFGPVPDDRPPLDAADAWAWFALLSLCAVQYFTTFITEFRMHFYMSSVALMCALSVMLVALTRRDGRTLLAELGLATPASAAVAVEQPALPEREPEPEPQVAETEPAPSSPPKPADDERESQPPAAAQAE